MIKRRFNSSDFGTDYVVNKNDLRTLMQDYIANEVERRLKVEMEDYFRNKYMSMYDEG